jgi:septum formation protein
VGEVAVVLASSSPRRRELLGRLGLDVTVRPVDVNETPHDNEDPVALVHRLARTKAAAAPAPPGGLVIAADTVVVLDDRILGKPADDGDAAAMLAALAGRVHEVLTGVAVRHADREAVGHAVTAVTFRPLTPAEIAWYVATGEPRDKAGAYGLQGAGAVLVERIDGSDTNVIGLPLALTLRLAHDVGADLLTVTQRAAGPPPA